MELGNAFFGCSRGQYPVPRGKGWEEALELVIEACTGVKDAWPDGCEFENEVFVIRPYYWGDCTCGYDAKEMAWCNAHHHAGDCYQIAYRAMTTSRSCLDPVVQRGARALCEQHGIPWNDGIGSACHCTCGHDKLWAEWSQQNNHAETCLLELPNFHHKPSGFKLKWYKYPLRDSYANQDVSLSRFAEICRDCVASIVVQGQQGGTQ